MLTALIVDDEAPARALMIRMLLAHPQIEVIGTAASVSEAKSFIQQATPDLVFLDLEMGEQSGFALAAWLSRDTRIVFVTAHPQCALEAFGVGAVDYLVKPVDPLRLAVSIERLDQRMSDTLEPTPNQITGTNTAGQVSLILLSDILWIEAQKNYTRLHGRFADRTLFSRKTLRSWEQELPADSFRRVSKSIMIQPGLIQTLRWNDRNTTRVMFMGSKLELQLGRLPALRLKAVLRG